MSQTTAAQENATTLKHCRRADFKLERHVNCYISKTRRQHHLSRLLSNQPRFQGHSSSLSLFCYSGRARTWETLGTKLMNDTLARNSDVTSLKFIRKTYIALSPLPPPPTSPLTGFHYIAVCSWRSYIQKRDRANNWHGRIVCHEPGVCQKWNTACWSSRHYLVKYDEWLDNFKKSPWSINSLLEITKFETASCKAD